MSRVNQSTLVSIILSIIVVFCMIVFIGLKRISTALSKIQGNPVPILLFLTLFTLAFGLRALRWRAIVPEAEFSVLLRSLYVAWFFNGITPARLGDAARIYLLKTEESVEIGEGLASVVIDRILDLVCLLAIFPAYLYLTIEGEKLSTASQFFLLATLIVTLAALVSVVLTAWKPNLIVTFIEKPIGILSQNAAKKISQLVWSASKGIRAFGRNRKALTWSLLLSFPIWVLESTSTYLVAQAMGIEEVSFTLCLLAATFAFFAMTIPITPAGWGSFELAIAAVLSLVLPLESALLVALVDHVIRQVYVALVGGVMLQTFSSNFSETLEGIKRIKSDKKLHEA
ncbi:MAG: lysylphosphatidylglycerol synthase transmembrane domain-containing protein [Candidatus Hodarchaeota archaeon]